MCRKIFFGVPQRGSTSKKVEFQHSLNNMLCSLNLCLKKHDSMQKELVQSDHPALRKRPKCAKILGYFVVGPKHQNRTTFWTFSRSQLVGNKLISFAMSQAPWDTSLDYPQHVIPRMLKFHFFLGWPPLGDPQKYFSIQKNYFPMFSYILVTLLDTCCN